MSFSSETKDELCRVPLSRVCCAQAEAYGILLYCHTFDRREIRIVTGSDALAARLPKLFRRAFGVEFDVLPEENSAGKRSLRITDEKKIFQILSVYGQENSLGVHINYGVLESDCCRQSFLRGAFLAGGSVTDPMKRYHLELICSHPSVSREAHNLLLEMGFSPRETTRSCENLTYFKQSEAIEDILTTMGAPLSAMAVMQARMEKDVSNTVNRRVNCDSANADKIVSAAQEQLAVIRSLDRRFGLKNLPESLQETAMLRIANPDSSLTDLATLADPPVSKSCMSHRMKKLMEFKGAD